MKKTIYLHRDTFPKPNHGSALTIGNFDGIHLGHQHLLARIVNTAQANAWVPTVMTFMPHAREYFAMRERRPELAPTRILTARDKITALRSCGIERILVQRFNQAFASLTPKEFIQNILVERLNTRWLTVGEDFRFGYKRLGDLELLYQAGKQFNFIVEPIENLVDTDGLRYSSTALRQVLAFGHMNLAQKMLGRPYQLSGHVIHGQKLGRTIGYPTLNLKVMPRCALRSGIYIVSVSGLAPTALPAIASLGVRPTVCDQGQVLLEAHLLDTKMDCYGKLVSISFLQYIRDEEKFPDLTTLMNAIRSDEQIARDYFTHHGL